MSPWSWLASGTLAEFGPADAHKNPEQSPTAADSSADLPNPHFQTRLRPNPRAPACGLQPSAPSLPHTVVRAPVDPEDTRICVCSMIGGSLRRPAVLVLAFPPPG